MLALCALLTLGLDALTWSELKPNPKPPMEPLAQIGSLSAERCGACHADIKREWEQSQHAAASIEALYIADLRHQGEPYFCNACHAPLTEQQPKQTHALVLAWPKLIPLQTENPRFDPKLQREGVTCVACHQEGTAMRGPHEPRGSPHAVRVTGELAQETLCEGCHTLALSRLGSFERPLMETVTEWREYRRLGGDKVCVDCHMPREGERRSHKLRGPVDLAPMAIEVRSVKVEGGRVEVTLFNGSGHRVPTAEPHRRVEVSLGGKTVRIERKVNLEALTESGDTTLKPREERVITFDVPPGAPAKLTVDFWLWDPKDPIALAAGLGRDALVKRIYEAEVP